MVTELSNDVRYLYSPALQSQEKLYQPRLRARLDAPPGFRTTLIACGPPIDTLFYGADDSYRVESDPAFGFEATVMPAIQFMQCPWKMELLPILVAQDHAGNPPEVCFLHDGVDIFYGEGFEEQLDIMAKQLAQISIFSRCLVMPGIERKKPFKWLQQGLPAHLAHGLYYSLKRNPYDEDVTILNKRYGLDWQRILKWLPAGEVQDEAVDIMDTVLDLHHTYLKDIKPDNPPTVANSVLDFLRELRG